MEDVGEIKKLCLKAVLRLVNDVHVGVRVLQHC